MRKYEAANVETYIAAAPAEARDTLVALRDLVLSTVKGVEEGISWGVPFYRHHGLLAGFSAFKAHALFGLCFRLSDDERAALEAKGYGTGLKTVKIRYGQKIPVTLLRALLRRQVKANLAKAKEKRETT